MNVIRLEPAPGPPEPTARDLATLFAVLACLISETLPDSQERSVALRKLFKARNAALRAEEAHKGKQDMSKDEEQIEAEIQAKGLTAPRLTPENIDAKIVAEQFHVFEGTTLTVCALTLRNGFVVTGESAAASPENFNEEIGRTIARGNARDKIWALEGYLLRERLSAA